MCLSPTGHNLAPDIAHSVQRITPSRNTPSVPLPHFISPVICISLSAHSNLTKSKYQKYVHFIHHTLPAIPYITLNTLHEKLLVAASYLHAYMDLPLSMCRSTDTHSLLAVSPNPNKTPIMLFLRLFFSATVTELTPSHTSFSLFALSITPTHSFPRPQTCIFLFRVLLRITTVVYHDYNATFKHLPHQIVLVTKHQTISPQSLEALLTCPTINTTPPECPVLMGHWSNHSRTCKKQKNSHAPLPHCT